MAKKTKKKSKPRPHGKDGRNNNGQFKKGNTLSRGNSGGGNKEKAKELKRAFIEAVSEKDIKAILKQLIIEAKSGEVPAIKELFDRLWGRAPQEVDFGERTAKTLLDILAVCGLEENDSN